MLLWHVVKTSNIVIERHHRVDRITAKLCHTLRKPRADITRQAPTRNPQGKRKRERDQKTPGDIAMRQTWLSWQQLERIAHTGDIVDKLWIA